jgi:hypothetical protein
MEKLPTEIAPDETDHRRLSPSNGHLSLMWPIPNQERTMTSLWKKLRTKLPSTLSEFISATTKTNTTNKEEVADHIHQLSWDEAVEKDRLILVEQAKKALVNAGYRLTKAEVDVVEKLGPIAAARVRTTMGTYMFPSERDQLHPFLTSLLNGTLPMIAPDRQPWLEQP